MSEERRKGKDIGRERESEKKRHRNDQHTAPITADQENMHTSHLSTDLLILNKHVYIFTLRFLFLE